MRIATTIVEANDDEEDNLDLFYEDSDIMLFLTNDPMDDESLSSGLCTR